MTNSPQSVDFYPKHLDPFAEDDDDEIEDNYPEHLDPFAQSEVMFISQLILTIAHLNIF